MANEATQEGTVFLSYSWKDKSHADQIDSDLQQFRIQVIRDVRDVKYRQRISAFMERIRETDFALLLLSDSYLKSQNCMTEALHLLDERDFEKKLLPVALGDAKLHDPSAWLTYTAHWKARVDELTRAVAQHSATSAIPTLQKLKELEAIHARINDFLSYISDIKHVAFDELRAEGYRSVLEAIGHVDATHLVELLQISVEPDLEQQETALDDWFAKYPPVSDAYGLRARIALRRNQLSRAQKNFEQAIELSPDNAAPLNNLGHLLWRSGKDVSRARELFERAIASMPNLAEARLNLGVLLSDKFEDDDGARAQYEAVIAINPAEPRSYNNLANLLRGGPDEKANSARICELFETALSLQPDYLDARLNYVNHLSEILGAQDAAEVLIAGFHPQTPEQQELVGLLRKRVAFHRRQSPPHQPKTSKNAEKRKRRQRRKKP
ncbi:MAG TPA: tetratricopeptide repeat protein [Polyangiaceae bacterium]